MFEREIKTKPLTMEDVEVLCGTVFDETGRSLTKEELLKCSNISKITEARDIRTGEMKPADEHHNRSKIPFFVIKAGSK